MKFKMSSRCPRKLKVAPLKSCPLALKRLTRQGGGCEWFIKDEDSNYCFWYYLYKHHKEHTVTEVANSWGTSVNNVSIAERAAVAKLLKILNT